MNRQRAACGAAVAATGAAGLGWWLTAAAAALLDAARSPVPLSPEDAVALLAACLGLLLLLWLALGVLATVLSLLPGRVGAAARRIADRVAPALSRRLAAVTSASSGTPVAIHRSRTACDWSVVLRLEHGSERFGKFSCVPPNRSPMLGARIACWNWARTLKLSSIRQSAPYR